MIIDFHTHTFPESLAKRTLKKLSQSAHMRYYQNGTNDDLCNSMQESGIDYSVILPIATTPTQHKTINQIAYQINQHTRESGLISFGGVHPDNDDYKQILHSLSANGFKGIKLHPVFQGIPFDDIRYMRIIEYAMEQDLIVVTHAGYDISFPSADYVSVSRIRKVIDAIHPDKLVLAHMGGWNEWENVFDVIIGEKVWLDTSFSITPLRHENGSDFSHTEAKQLSYKDFCRLVRFHGCNKIIFGSDAPWTSQKEALSTLRQTGLTEEELKMIEGENAYKLLFK